MYKTKPILLIITVILTLFCCFGCKDTAEVDSIVSSSKRTTVSKVVKTEDDAKQIIKDYIYLNCLDFSVYENQTGKISKSIKKDGFYYFAVYETVNDKNVKCNKFFAVEKKTSTIYSVDKTGKMVSVFEDSVLGPKK